MTNDGTMSQTAKIHSGDESNRDSTLKVELEKSPQ
jgi:hypothetical protein